MKAILTIFALMLCLTCFGEDTITISDPSDSRLLAYRDSQACYEFGLYQVELARYIKNPNDTAEGHQSMIQLEAKRISLHLSDRYRLRDFDDVTFRKIKIRPVRYGT